MENPSSKKIDFAAGVDFSNILTNPILDIGARLWEKERYEAFRVCYRSMRKIDDLVDHKKAEVSVISNEDTRQMEAMMAGWLDTVRQKDFSDPFNEEFCFYLDKFRIPLWPWERLIEAMVYDLKHRGFKTFLTFVRYARGAAIAPASIFMHLCGVRRQSENYRKPDFDIRRASRPLALFSYLVHIIRDFQKDQANDLQYFADDLLAEKGLGITDLRNVAATGQISGAFRELMATYVRIAEFYRNKARNTIAQISPMLQPRYQLSLEMIYQLYLQIFERIDPHRGTFTGAELQPEPAEIDRRIRSVLDNFNLENK
jgi:phytoene/squalene synthetase